MRTFCCHLFWFKDIFGLFSCMIGGQFMPEFVLNQRSISENMCRTRLFLCTYLAFNVLNMLLQNLFECGYYEQYAFYILVFKVKHMQAYFCNVPVSAHLKKGDKGDPESDQN